MTETLTSRHDAHAEYAQRMRDERLLNRVGALGRIFERWANQAEHRRRTTWPETSVLGATGHHAGRAFTVTGRQIGVATVTFEDGETRTIDAPTPCM